MVNILYGLRAGGFGSRSSLTFAADRPSFATSADFNQDGTPDLAYSDYSGSGSTVVVLGLAGGGFQLKQVYTEPLGPRAIASADFWTMRTPTFTFVSEG
jgi:hypothetical protein